MDVKITGVRLRRIRQQMRRLKVDCLVVTKPANVTYITGFTGDDSWAVVFHRTAALVTDSRYTEQSGQECQGCRIIERKAGMAKAVADVVSRQRKVKMAGIEKSTSVAAFERLKKHLKCRVKAVGAIVETVRRTKDKAEVRAIRTAGEIAGRVFERVRRRVRSGMTENELAGVVDFEIRKLGGRSSFETIVAFGGNASRPHHRPGTRKLKKNDTVLIDFGVRYKGYCCDVTKCFAVGRPGRLFGEVYEAVERAREAALKMIKAGVEIKRIDSAAREAIRDSALPVYGHGTGHGLGLEVHELPVVSDKAEGKLQAGDVITIEPAVYIPGKLGVRLEDDILVTEGGYIMLSGGVGGGRLPI